MDKVFELNKRERFDALPVHVAALSDFKKCNLGSSTSYLLARFWLVSTLHSLAVLANLLLQIEQTRSHCK